MLLLAEFQQYTAFFRGHFTVCLHFPPFITVTHTSMHSYTHKNSEIQVYTTLISMYTHAQLLTLLGAPSGMGESREKREESREKESEREEKEEKRESLTSVLIITTVPSQLRLG